MAGLIAALDTADIATARGWAEALAPHCAILKLGLEFFVAHGPQGVRAATNHPVFLDLKLHDIPNTVAGAVRAALPLKARMLTLHASGGAAMVAAAQEAAEGGGSARPALLAITVLTSLGAEALHSVGVAGGVRQQVLRLARAALDAGADGLVCAAPEVAMLRDAFGARPVLVVPGVRPEGEAPGDQARVATPRAVAAAGADWLVVGRPITRAADPAAMAARIAAEIA